jgi:hypothetical protein
MLPHNPPLCKNRKKRKTNHESTKEAGVAKKERTFFVFSNFRDRAFLVQSDAEPVDFVTPRAAQLGACSGILGAVEYPCTLIEKCGGQGHWITGGPI